MADSRGCLQPTATVVAAVIGLVGTIAAAWIGIEVGRSSKENQAAGLTEELQASQAQAAQLTRTIEDKNSEIASLRAKQSDLERQLASLRSHQKDVTPPRPAPEGDDPQPPGTPVFNPHQTADGFDFAYKRCASDGADLRCVILVTNRREVRKIMISNKSRLVGTDGRSFRPAKVINEVGTAYNTATWLELPTNVPLEFSLLFSGIANSLREASLLEVKSGEFAVSWGSPPIR